MSSDGDLILLRSGVEVVGDEPLSCMSDAGDERIFFVSLSSSPSDLGCPSKCVGSSRLVSDRDRLRRTGLGSCQENAIQWEEGQLTLPQGSSRRMPAQRYLRLIRAFRIACSSSGLGRKKEALDALGFESGRLIWIGTSVLKAR